MAPFHVVPGEDRSTRRMLLVSYVFPPARDVGGLRWQKMARFAAERGWGVDVICVDPASLAEQDAARLAELPPGTRLYGVARPEPLIRRTMQRLRGARPAAPPRAAAAPAPAPEPAPAVAAAGGAVGGSMSREEVLTAPATARQRLRRAAFAADSYLAWRRWMRDVVTVGRAVLGGRHAAVVSSGPPHMAHVAARALARGAGLPHVADLRDPWSLNERVPEPIGSPLHYRLAVRDEGAVVRDAALVVCNTEAAAAALRAVHPAQAARIVTVMNGSDEESIPAVERGARFVAMYAGVVYIDRDPTALFRAAARVVRALGLSPAEFGIEFLSNADHPDGRPLVDVAAAEGLGGYVTVHGLRPRAEAMRMLAGAALLVSLPQDSHLAIPSKIFEYANFDAWLLSLAEPGSATAEVLAGTGADVVEPSDVAGLAAVLRQRYEAWAAGARPRAINADGRFDRRRQAEPLLDRLDALARR